MNLSEFDLRNFLTFHVRKGLEEGEVITLRTSTIKHMEDVNLPLLITVEKEPSEIMLVTIDSLMPRILSQTKENYGKGTNKYGLARLHWRPTDEGTLKIMDKLQTMQRNFLEDIEVTFNLVKNKL